MSLVYQFTVLALASTVLAVPHIGHGHAHAHRHLHSYPSSLPFPYSRVNGTSIGYKGTGIPYSTPSSIPGYPSKIPSSVPAYGISGTLTSTDYETVTQTIQYPSSSVSEAAAGYGYGSGSGSSAASGEQCGLEVTVTSTEKVYVTVTAGQAPSSSESSPVESSYSRPTSTIHITHTHTVESYGSPSAPSVPAYSAPSSSSEIVPVYSSKTPVYSAPSASVYSASSSSSESAPVYSSTPIYSAPTSSISVASYETSSSSESVASYSTSSTPTPVLPILSTYSPVAKQVGTTSVSSAAAVPTSSSTPSGGKRGLAYNAADLTTCFDGSEEISWAYNWVSASAGLTGNLSFIPTLHDGSATFTSVWEVEASASIATGSNTLFSFNEPDQPTQANMSPEDAAAGYKQYMNPFAGKAKLCAPSVTSAQNDENMGLPWLQKFIAACNGGCDIDYYNIHWYSPPDVAFFKQQVNAALAIEPQKPIYISEFGLTGATDEQVTSFLEEVMPWLDSNDGVIGYAYYYVADGVLLTGDEPSTYGKTYMSYTA